MYNQFVIVADCVARAEVIAKVLAGFLTPVIAIFGAYIAWQQFGLSRQKIRLDLYDRRLRVYQAVTNLFAEVAREGDVSRSTLGSYYADVFEARFLFGKDLKDYLTEVRQKASKLGSINFRLADSRASQATVSSLAQEKELVLYWFDQQIEDSAARFEPYLSFKNTH
jgi:hypothetical protein